MLVFPLVGLIVIRYGLRNGFRARRLLAEGLLTQGTLESNEATNTHVNDQRVHRLTFRFEADSGGTYLVERKTHLVDSLTDQVTESIVYDPRHPADAITIDDLPGRPVIDDRGELASGPREAISAIGNLVLPTVTVVGHGLFLYFFR